MGSVLNGLGADIRLYDSFGVSEGFSLEASADNSLFFPVGTFGGEGDCSRVRRIRVMPPIELDPPGPPGPTTADLSVVANDAPDPVMVNTSFVYMATATNLGPGNATGVRLLFITPGAATFLSAPSGCVNSGTTTCTVGRDARIAKLESVLEESRRAGKRQAAPFSKDKPKRDPKKPGRKPGSKYGRQAVRAIPVPDKTFEAPCPEQCPCGGKVGAEGSIDLYQVDIPPIQPETWKFVVGHGHCQECGRRVRGQHPLLISKAFEVGTVHFGPRLLAFAAFQKMICGVSYDKIRLGFEQMLGFPVARSTLCRAMQRLARRAKPTRDALVEALRASPVVYADETGWKQGGRRVWLWVFTNLRETVYEILPGRGFEQAASVLGKNYAGTLGVDGWAPYRCFKEATLQTCYNHLLHRCHELLETATRGAVRFPRLVKAILRHALALRDRRDAGEISPHGLRVAKGLLQAKMNRLLHGRFTNPANQRFAKHLRRYRDNLFVFLDRADIEATNYPAEQDIRIAVVNRKTCGGGNRTAKGAQAQSILMSVLQSCRHKGIRVIDIVTSILRAPDNTPVPLVNPER